MNFDDQYFQAREEAIAWLNRRPERRDYAVGVAILGRMRFKPLLQRRLAMSAGNDVLQRILVQAVTDGCNFYRNPSSPKYADEVPAEVVNITDAPKPTVAEQTAAATTQPDEKLPGNVRTIVRWFARAYKLREILHREMRGVGEGNDAQSVERRRSLSERINVLSEYMDRLYPLRESYFQGGDVPSDQTLEQIGPPERLAPSAPASAPQSSPSTVAASLRIKDEDYDAMTVGALRRRKHSVRTLATKKRNLLLYQSENKAAKENPMPSCPRRTKIETQLRSLDEKLYAIDKALARKG